MRDKDRGHFHNIYRHIHHPGLFQPSGAILGRWGPGGGGRHAWAQREDRKDRGVYSPRPPAPPPPPHPASSRRAWGRKGQSVRPPVPPGDRKGRDQPSPAFPFYPLRPGCPREDRDPSGRGAARVLPGAKLSAGPRLGGWAGAGRPVQGLGGKGPAGGGAREHRARGRKERPPPAPQPQKSMSPSSRPQVFARPRRPGVPQEKTESDPSPGRGVRGAEPGQLRVWGGAAGQRATPHGAPEPLWLPRTLPLATSGAG